jgi:hypothetical protein
MPAIRAAEDRPDRAHEPLSEGQIRFGHAPLHAAEAPLTEDERAAKYARARTSSPCVCDPYPCSPSTGCTDADGNDCKPCLLTGPLFPD